MFSETWSFDLLKSIWQPVLASLLGCLVILLLSHYADLAAPILGQAALVLGQLASTILAIIAVRAAALWLIYIHERSVEFGYLIEEMADL